MMLHAMIDHEHFHAGAVYMNCCSPLSINDYLTTVAINLCRPHACANFCKDSVFINAHENLFKQINTIRNISSAMAALKHIEKYIYKVYLCTCLHYVFCMVKTVRRT